MSDGPHQNQMNTGIPCAVLTVSDTRTAETDRSGSYIRMALASAGHVVCRYLILPDEPRTLRSHVESLCSTEDCRAVLITGGTGLSSRDTTYEALEGLLEKRLDGFGELFRQLSFREIGSAAMLSRATAGVRGRTAVFSMPGSPAAVRLAMDQLIVPQLGHIAWLLRSQETQS